MNHAESYRSKVFVVASADARIRRDDDLMAYERTPEGQFRTIAQGARARITEVKVVESGSRSLIVFGHATSEDGAQRHGWTSTRNLERKFINETIGILRPAPGAGRYGPNAAWAHGKFVGQVDLVRIVDSKLEIESLALSTIAPYATLVAAAAADGVDITLNSGFRSYPEQRYLHDGYTRRLPGFSLAAKPGYSLHQNGLAFDLDVGGKDGSPAYEWLKQHATSFGFVRTVSGEPWHWEFDQAKAQAARANQSYKTPNVTS